MFYCYILLKRENNTKFINLIKYLGIMKLIGLSDEVYKQLLWVKHEYEKKDNKVLSYDKIIFKLIQNLNGEIKDGKNKEVKG